MLHTDPWVGERIFQIEHPRCTDDLPRRDEFTLVDGQEDVSYRSYSQQQKCIDYYSRAKCKEWFKFRPEVLDRCPGLLPIRAHRRENDYAPLGYVVVSKESYLKAAEKFGFGPSSISFVKQDDALKDKFFDGWADFMPDFLALCMSENLFRANSSFSWWAATLSGARVFSPVITGLKGGQEQDCEFCEGNWPRFADLSFVTDLHLAP